MIYNFTNNKRFDKYNLTPTLTNKSREYYDCFDINRPYSMKVDTITNSRRGYDFVGTYKSYKYENPKYLSDKIKSGGGLITSMINADKIKNLIQKGYDAYGSETATKIKNIYVDSFMNPNPLSRSGFAGERHLLMNDGSQANFAGPGTHLMTRIRRGDQPIDILDAQAKQHDIDYKKARNVSDVDKADKRLIKSMEEIKGRNPMKTVIKVGMKAKQLAHKIGLPKNSFTGRNILSDGKSFNLTQQDDKDIAELKQMGYGKVKKVKGKKKELKMKRSNARKLKLKKRKDPLEILRNKIVY
jgi:hypothetical protein